MSGAWESRAKGARLTSRAFTDLAIWMVGFGLVIGLVFPYAIVPLGVDQSAALRPTFFAATVTAGLLVGGINYALARSVVGNRLRRLAHRMHHVADSIDEATYSGDWSRCDAASCALEVDSADEFGEAAASFNQLVTALETSREVEEALSGYARRLTLHLEIDKLADSALQGALVHSGADAGAVCVVDDGEISVAATHRLDGDEVASSPYLRDALREGEVSVISVGDELAVEAVAVRFRPSAVAVAPVRFKGVPVGVLVLAFAHAPSPQQLRLLDSLRDATGIALNNALVHERFQRLAAIDPLTGLYNRRFGLSRLREEFARALRTQSPLGLLALDLDHFKSVNDTHGHLAGDQVLREVTATAAAMLRDGDVFVRSGGEEFLVVLPGAGPEDLRLVAERIRRAVQETRVQVNGDALQVTVSLGGVSYPQTDADAAEALLDHVDTALYRSKEHGRNRLTMCAADDTALAG